MAGKGEERGEYTPGVVGERISVRGERGREERRTWQVGRGKTIWKDRPEDREEKERRERGWSRDGGERGR